MSVLHDFSGTIIANIMQQLGMSKTNGLDEDFARHMTINSILSIRKKFINDGELIIAFDGRNYWRKEIFPYYKHSRKKARQTSKYDWAAIYSTINKIKVEIKENMPYRWVEVHTAEADDVIACLCKREAQRRIIKEIPEDIIIVSNDKDHAQLQKYPFVRQWSPLKKQFIKVDNPREALIEHICRGDESDGVPNFLSSDDVFVVPGARQRQLRDEKIANILVNGPSEENLRGYKRNETLISFDCIPDNIYKEVCEQLDACKVTRKKMFSYFVANKLKLLLEDINCF